MDLAARRRKIWYNTRRLGVLSGHDRLSCRGGTELSEDMIDHDGRVNVCRYGVGGSLLLRMGEQNKEKK